MRCSKLFLAALALLLSVTGQAKAGTVYNAVTGFNLTGTNPVPGNPWAYGTETTLGGTFAPMTVFAALGQPTDSVYFFNDNLIGPAIGENTTGSTINLGGTPPLLWPTNVLLFAPGGSNNPGSPNFAVVQWTAPASGTYDVSGLFMNIQESNNNVHVFAETTSGLVTVLSDSTSFDGTEPYGAQVSFSATMLTINAGQTIDFVVGNNNYPGADSEDVNGLAATIQSVPEPSSLTLCVVGVAALTGWCGWRRRR
jgi:hypothetical protein